MIGKKFEAGMRMKMLLVTVIDIDYLNIYGYCTGNGDDKLPNL